MSLNLTLISLQRYIFY